MTTLQNPPDTELPPRRAQIMLTERDLKQLLGLATDERVHGITYNPATSLTQIVIESPRLPPLGYPTSDGYRLGLATEAPYIKLPLSDSYERPSVGAETHQTQDQLT